MYVEENIKYLIVLTAHLLLSHLQKGTEAGKLNRKYIEKIGLLALLNTGGILGHKLTTDSSLLLHAIRSPFS
jgi:hypothetical protein